MHIKMKKILLSIAFSLIVFGVSSQTVVKVNKYDQLFTYSDSVRETTNTVIFDFKQLEEVVDITWQAFGTNTV